jgi:Concanavalin A-like lectin/glucanases superfamily
VSTLAAYNFDEESGNVLDYSGAGHGFALNNSLQRTAAGAGVDATTGTTSATGRGLTRNGGAGSMGLIADPSFLSASAWTIMFWQQNPGGGVWWLRLYNAAADTGSGVLNVGGTLRLRIRTAAGSNIETTTTPPAADNSWHHYAATYDGTNGRFYVDGVLVGTTATASSPAAIDRIDIAEHTLTNFAMDDVRILDEVLSQPAIAAAKDTPVSSSESADGAVSLALTAVLAASGERVSAGEANLITTNTLVATGVRESAGESALAATAGFAVSGSSVRSGTVNLSVTALLTAGQTAAERDIALAGNLGTQPRRTAQFGSQRWAASLGEQ